MTVMWGIWMVNAKNIDSEFSDFCTTYVKTLPAELQDHENCDQNVYDALFTYGPWDTSNESDLKDAV